MGVKSLRTALTRHHRVALDTSVFIYYLEANPKYLALTDCIFSILDREFSAVVTSTITMTELLVKPYRESNWDSADKCFMLLSTCPNLEWIAASLTIADLAARIRANYGLRTPDALQAATALHANASAFITNDPVFRRIKDFNAVVLDDFV